MPSSKTDTAIRLPEREDQTRRIRNTTQDRKWASRMEGRRTAGEQKASDTTSWSAQQMLGSNMDQAGNPNPDPVSFNDGTKARRNRVKPAEGEEEMDVYEAMNQQFD